MAIVLMCASCAVVSHPVLPGLGREDEEFRMRSCVPNICSTRSNRKPIFESTPDIGRDTFE